MRFPILFEDEHLIVINKPCGLVVHPGAGREAESVVSAVLSHCPLSPTGAPFRPGVVHRLDKGTSGVMVLAKTEEAHKRLAKMFAGRTVQKEYLALAQGRFETDRGRIEVSIERDRVQRKRMKATFADRGRMSITEFEVLQVLAGASLVRLRLLTGRTHQIRVHLSHLGHPLIGDVLYGGRRWQGKAHHFLHSTRLAFPHPITKEPLEFTTPVPEAFSQQLKAPTFAPPDSTVGKKKAVR